MDRIELSVKPSTKEKKIREGETIQIAFQLAPGMYLRM